METILQTFQSSVPPTLNTTLNTKTKQGFTENTGTASENICLCSHVCLLCVLQRSPQLLFLSENQHLRYLHIKTLLSCSDDSSNKHSRWKCAFVKTSFESSTLWRKRSHMARLTLPSTQYMSCSCSLT